MKNFHPLNRRSRAWPSLAAMAATVFAVSGLLAVGADKPLTTPKATDAKKETAAASTKKTSKKLTGSELYAINCNRCHPERYPTEFKSDQWKTLMTHMRVRANIPVKQAREILKYLQEDAGS